MIRNRFTCGRGCRGCRKPSLDEMVHAYPEKLSALKAPKRKRRRAA